MPKQQKSPINLLKNIDLFGKQPGFQVQGKDTYDTIKNTISSQMKKEQNKIRDSFILQVTNITKKVSSVALIPNTVGDTINELDINTHLIKNDDGYMEYILPGNKPYSLCKLYRQTKFDDTDTLDIKLHKIILLATGDFMYVCCMSGMAGMASHWCPYCTIPSSKWQQERPTTDEIKDALPTKDSICQDLATLRLKN